MKSPDSENFENSHKAVYTRLKGKIKISMSDSREDYISIKLQSYSLENGIT